MPRTILHLDLDAFFCAVEEQRDVALVGTAFAVGGRPEERGVVSSCSYAARVFGVHSAMAMKQALALCPQLVLVAPHFPAYHAASAQVMARLRALTPLVEQISIDEAFLDVSELPEAAECIAARLQAAIREELGLPCSIGVASNKLVAKIATEVAKAGAAPGVTPSAICAVPPGREAGFLAPLPAHALWGVGPKTAEQLAALGIRTIGDISAWPEADLARRFGRRGYDLARHARGIDEREVVTTHAPKSVSSETTFARDVKDGAALRHALREQAAGVARRLQAEELCGTTVKLKLRWPDFTTLTRQVTLAKPSDQEPIIYEHALQLFEAAWSSGRAVRLIGLGVSGLGMPVRQMNLWEVRPEADPEKRRKAQEAIRALRDKFGEGVVKGGNP